MLCGAGSNWRRKCRRRGWIDYERGCAACACAYPAIRGVCGYSLRKKKGVGGRGNGVIWIECVDWVFSSFRLLLNLGMSLPLINESTIDK